MKSIGKALQFMLLIASDDSHGYDQTNRNGPDYDCSSLVGTALHEAGFNVSPTSWTGNLYSQLIKEGFTQVNEPWEPGDIHLTPGHHVCMSVDANTIVHARSNEYGKVTGGKPGDQTGNEISTSLYYVPSYGWTYHLRYVGDTDEPKPEWSDDVLAKRIISGAFGNGDDRVRNLKRIGLTGKDIKRVQRLVNIMLSGVKLKTKEEIVREVIQGKWGNGDEREARLTEAGWVYNEIQAIVNLYLHTERK